MDAGTLGTTRITDTPPSDDAGALASRLSSVRAVVARVARQHRLDPDAQQDLLGDVLLRLVDRDYAVLRKFRGEAAFTTYLRTVVLRVLLDQRVRVWGKWRPSRRSRSLGPAAEKLERLIVRDRMPWREAVGTLDSLHDGVDREMALDLCRRVRPLTRPRMVPLTEQHRETTVAQGYDPIERRDTGRRARRITQAVFRACNDLNVCDRRLLVLRFREGRKVVDIARITGCDQKALYRRYEHLCRCLREHLVAQGITTNDIRQHFARAGAHDVPPALWHRA